MILEEGIYEPVLIARARWQMIVMNEDVQPEEPQVSRLAALDLVDDKRIRYEQIGC